MFSNTIESILRNAGASLLTEAFILIMLVVFFQALILNKMGTWNAFTSYTATLLTSLGILGTFAGVVTGLLDFDSSVGQIDSSIESLLEGLKTAFTSSLVGMTLSILYKMLVLIPWLSPSKSKRSTSVVTIESLYEIEKEQAGFLHAIATAMAGRDATSVLKQLDFVCGSLEWMQQQIELSHKEQTKSNEKQLEVLERTLQALSDDGESSLTGQLKLVRTDANDIGKNLSGQLEKANSKLNEQHAYATEWWSEQKIIMESSFGQLDAQRLNAINHANESNEQRSAIRQLLERSPTETLIAALEDVIRDFNKHISEQFGENFKELNVAVGRMIEWQENYRSQIDLLQQSFESSAESIGNCERSMVTIERSSESIPEYMKDLSEVLDISRHQLNELENHLQAFADLKERAVESVPILNGIVEDVVKKVEFSTTQMMDGCEEGNRKFVEAMNFSVNALTKSSGEVNTQLEKAATRTATELQVMLEGLRRSIEAQFENSTESVEKLIDTEFKNMEEVRRTQTVNIMQEMGAALTSITGQFTRDYGSLVGAMKNIVETGERRGS